MIKAAVDFRYGTSIYKEGDSIPDSLVSELEKQQSHTLSTFVDVNGSWHRIDDPLIAGWVQQRKNVERRLIKHFKEISTKESELDTSKEIPKSDDKPKKKVK